MREGESKAHSVHTERFDPQHGGFGAAPKFPRPSELLFMLGEYHRVHDEKVLEMALFTLRKMAEGGVNDHLAGGFRTRVWAAIARPP